MVQALTAAALLLTASTAIAAPIFDETLVSREPEPNKFWNKVESGISKVGHGIESVANTVGTVAYGVNSAVSAKNGISSLRGKKREPEAEDLEVRDPSFKSFIKGVGKDIGAVANTVGNVAYGINSAVDIKNGVKGLRGKRELDMEELEVRDVSSEPLTARDLQIIQILAARDPSFGSFLKGVEKGIGKVAQVVAPVAKIATKFIREEPTELSARQIEALQELAVRDPSFGSFIKGVEKGIGKVAQVVAPVAKIATKFIREESALSAREVEILEELIARDPSFGSFLKGVEKGIGKVAQVVAPVAKIATKFIREEPTELSAREVEILEDLIARDPSFGSFIKGVEKGIGKVAQVVAPVAKIATKFIREEGDLVEREVSLDELD